MEVDSGAERTYHNALVNVPTKPSRCCDLILTVTLHQLQYDQSLLTVKGQCLAEVKVNERVLGDFIVVEVSTQYPLFGRAWMMLQLILMYQLN